MRFIGVLEERDRSGISGCWLLLLALVAGVLGASSAPAYDLVADNRHTCVIDDNGVSCWGLDGDGQATVPAGLSNPTAVAAGFFHTCAVDDNGVNCWGSDLFGQSTVPAGLSNPSAIGAGGYHTCAIDDNGVSCWGLNGDGQATVPAGLSNPSTVAVGGFHTCAIDDNGVTCWGGDSVGQATAPAGLVNPTTIAAGRWHTCAIDDNGAACWGWNLFGQSTVPAGLVNPTAIAAGWFHTCAIDDNGVTCWGRNNAGQSTVPAGLMNPTIVAAGGNHTCALDDDGVSCWGLDGNGQATVPDGLSFLGILDIEIDIRPGSDDNPINPMLRGVIPVAILGSDTFDVADVDRTTLAFGPDGAAPSQKNGGYFQDVNDDGLTDLMSLYWNDETGVAFGDTEACLTGETLDGTPIEGCDNISTMPPPCGDGGAAAFLVLPLVWIGIRCRRARS